MSPPERITRLEVAVEIIEGVLVDFLEEHPTEQFSTFALSQNVGVLDDRTCEFILDRLLAQKRVANHGSINRNRWQAHE